MRLASWNTWKNDGDYRTRLAQMGAVLRALSADAVLLQECFRAEPDADTCAYLAAATGLTPIYAPARRKRRRFENSERDSESGLAVLTRWPLLDHDVIPLPSSDIGGERIALLVRVQTARGPLRLACVHLSHVRAEATLRRAQLEHVMARLADTARANETVLIGGDFNCARGDAEFAAAQPPPGWTLVDALHELGHAQPTFPVPPKPDRAGRRIDFILAMQTTKTVVAAQAGIQFTAAEHVWPSDHALIWTDWESAHAR